MVTLPPFETWPLPLVWMVPVAPEPERLLLMSTARLDSLKGNPEPVADPSVAIPPVS